MKSVLQAVNLLTVAFGNVIVIIVAEAKAFDQVSFSIWISRQKWLIFHPFQASEFFMFGCLMFADMALFAYLAYRYKYVNIEGSNDSVSNNNENIPMEEKPSSKDEE